MTKQDHFTTSVQRTRAVLNRVLDNRALNPVNKAFLNQIDITRRNLKTQLKAKQGSVVPSQILPVLALGVKNLTNTINQSLMLAMDAAAHESFDATSKMLNTLNEASSEIDDVQTRSDLISDEIDQAKDDREKALAALAVLLFGSLKSHTDASLLRGDTPLAFLMSIEDYIESQWWMVERTLMTEVSRIFNGTQSAIIKKLGLWSRWTELVDDLSGKPLDKRVGQDSLAIHGQVAPPGGKFTMPSAPKVSRSLVGKSWYYPPNRPHDRAILVPWEKSWGISGWVLQSGQRVPL